MNELEIRSTQKRFLTTLLEIEKEPEKIKSIIKKFSFEMQQEDVALVMKGMEEV